MTSEPSDADPVEQVRSRGETAAYEGLVNRYQGHAYGLAYVLVGDWAEAEDMTQEAFIRAYVNLPRLQDPTRFAAWFRRIVFSTCMDRLRQHHPIPDESMDQLAEMEHLMTDTKVVRPPEELAGRELGQTILAAIAELPPKYRIPITMFHLNGLSYEKVASFLDVPLGTAKSLIHRARAKLKDALGAYAAKEVTPMVKEVFDEHKLRTDLAKHVLERIEYWERFGRGESWPDEPNDKARQILADRQWCRLLEVELELESLSEEGREIRRQIATLERCHEAYLKNVQCLLEMIGSTTPRQIIDCGAVRQEHADEAKAYRGALELWMQNDALPADAEEPTHTVFKLLGARDDRKEALVNHTIAKLDDNGYHAYAWEDEDFETTESRITHLEICNYDWRQNLLIVLDEIGNGQRTRDWHTPEGFNTCGDCPNRVSELQPILETCAAWVEGDVDHSGELAGVLGEPTTEKRWLVGSLCKHIETQHRDLDVDSVLRVPQL